MIRSGQASVVDVSLCISFLQVEEEKGLLLEAKMYIDNLSFLSESVGGEIALVIGQNLEKCTDSLMLVVHNNR